MITEEIQEIKAAQQSVLAAIENNHNMMSTVANHMEQGCYDGRYGVLPPEMVDENTPPQQHQANAMTSEMSTIMKQMADEISNLRGEMKNMQNNAYQPPPFNPNFQYGYGGG